MTSDIRNKLTNVCVHQSGFPALVHLQMVLVVEVNDVEQTTVISFISVLSDVALYQD